MAFNADQDSPNVHYLVEIVLDTITLRYAEVDLARSDGTLWKGLLIPNTSVRSSLGSLRESKFTTASFTITLDNHDDYIRGLLDQYQVANRAVIIYIGDGAASGNYSEWIRGVIRFPGGVSYNQGQATIACDDPRERDALNLPTTRFDPATYTNMETKSYYKPIPIVYGDWRTTAGGGEKIPAYQTDSTIGTGGRFHVANHCIKAIEAVYKNGASVSFTGDEVNGRFTLNVAYTPATDTITVNCRGATVDATTAGALLENPALILKDLVKTWLGKADADLDLTAFTLFQTNTTSTLCRRWIGGERLSSHTLIQDLMIESWCDLAIITNLYTPVYRIVADVGTLTNMKDYDILKSGSGSSASFAFQVQRDPDRLFCNKVEGSYQYDPVAGTYAKVYSFQDAASQASALTTMERPTFSFKWIYVTTDIQNRVQLEVYVFGSAEVEVLNVTLLNRSIFYDPTDQFGLIFDKYGTEATAVGAPFQVRSSERRMGQLINTIVAWNMLSLSPGRWTGPAATTWLLSTAYEQWSQGYWTDASGFADTGGSPAAASKRSRWF